MTDYGKAVEGERVKDVVDQPLRVRTDPTAPVTNRIRQPVPYMAALPFDYAQGTPERKSRGEGLRDGRRDTVRPSQP